MSQHLALTPQLQQSIRLLQLSTLELNQEIEQILSDNPLLERADDPFESALRVRGDGTIDPERYAAPDGEASDEPSDAARTDPGVVREAMQEPDFSGDWQGDASRRQNDDSDEPDMRQLSAMPITLRVHLLEQLATTQFSTRDRGLVRVLIDAVNEDGYLSQGLDEIATMLPDELAIEEAELSTALCMLQSFDPSGVGARSASECLALQLRDLAGGPALDADATTLAFARIIVTDHLALLAAHDYTRLKRLLRCTDDDLRNAHALIRRLVPFPGRPFTDGEAHYVVPDVVVRRVRGIWRASLNPDVLPRLRINRVYAQILRGQRSSDSGSTLSARLQEARWLIKNVQQRFDTILRVSEAIVERQRNFFTHGEVAMRPLVLREIADTLGLHESTVSRVTTQKFMLTPLGTFELKYFFGSHVATQAGGAASSTAIRALIRQLIGAEDSKRPLSDSKIADLLGEQGIVVARRTIAKYREALRIPPVSLRKSL